MTDRDTLAAAALPFVAKRGLTDEQVAAHCYRWADTMLRVRNGAVESRETVCPHVRGTVTQHCSLNFTLTDEEREAIESAVADCDQACCGEPEKWLTEIWRKRSATLRGLLERLK